MSENTYTTEIQCANCRYKGRFKTYHIKYKRKSETYWTPWTATISCGKPIDWEQVKKTTECVNCGCIGFVIKNE